MPPACPRFLFSFLVTLLVAARAPSAEPDAAKLASIPAKMREFVERGEIAGAVTVVGTREGIASLDASGNQDLERTRPMARNALFRIASMTKPVNAIAVFQLIEAGRLTVNDPVEKILPEFRGQLMISGRSAEGLTLKKPSRPITVRDLLTHTSGMPGGLPEGLSDLYLKRNRTLAEAVLAFSQRPLEFEPGTRWAYCNLGMDTLGRIIEVLSGQPYEKFLEDRIFRPLGMTDTTFYPGTEQLARLAVMYERKDGRLVPAGESLIGPPSGARYPVPAGGLYSTAEDLSRLYRMMLGGGALGGTRILKEESVADMTRLQTGDLAAGFTPGMGAGYGWLVVRTPTGVTEVLSSGSYGHGGAFGTQAWIDPRRGFFIILLIQRRDLPNSDASDMRRELQALAAAAMRT